MSRYIDYQDVWIFREMMFEKNQYDHLSGIILKDNFFDGDFGIEIDFSTGFTGRGYSSLYFDIGSEYCFQNESRKNHYTYIGKNKLLNVLYEIPSMDCKGE